jgi:hypothetical protein
LHCRLCASVLTEDDCCLSHARAFCSASMTVAFPSRPSRKCCGGDLDFARSLCRCRKWKSSGGKSNVFFAKTLDDRFVIKQVTQTELNSFLGFGPQYFHYLSDALSTGAPTCLAKTLGIYQVSRPAHHRCEARRTSVEKMRHSASACWSQWRMRSGGPLQQGFSSCWNGSSICHSHLSCRTPFCQCHAGLLFVSVWPITEICWLHSNQTLLGIDAWEGGLR